MRPHQLQEGIRTVRTSVNISSRGRDSCADYMLSHMTRDALSAGDVELSSLHENHRVIRYDPGLLSDLLWSR
jgi:hypothetical protein